MARSMTRAATNAAVYVRTGSGETPRGSGKSPEPQMRSRHTRTAVPAQSTREYWGESPGASDHLEAPAHSVVPAQSPPRALEGPRASAQRVCSWASLAIQFEIVRAQRGPRLWRTS
eukprot:13401257-Alexandrium_andersonii.AAC.1